jgi:hypothetical protein
LPTTKILKGTTARKRFVHFLSGASASAANRRPVSPSYYVGTAGNVTAQTIIERCEHIEKRRYIAKRQKKPKAPTTQRTGLDRGRGCDVEPIALDALQVASATAGYMLVPIVVEVGCWNRYILRLLAYRDLHAETPLGSQMCCNVLQRVTGSPGAQRRQCRLKPCPAWRESLLQAGARLAHGWCGDRRCKQGLKCIGNAP